MSHQRAKVKASRQREDKEKLELFLALAMELATSDLAKNGFGYEYGESWGRAEGFKQELKQPGENDLRSFLTTFRKFISDDSDAYLQGIHGICHRRLTREDYRVVLDKANAHWRQLFKYGWMRLTMDGREFPPEYTLKVYINGKYLHDDLDYAEELAQLEQHNPMGFLLHRSQFLAGIVDTANYIDWLAGNVDYFLQKGLLKFDD
jgi:hypothetical protein